MVVWLIGVLFLSLAVTGYSKDSPEEVDRAKINENSGPSDAKLKVTGYDWIKYSKNEKLKFMEAIFAYYKLDQGKYSVKKGVRLLDVYYKGGPSPKKAQKRNEYDFLYDLTDTDGLIYSFPCLITFGSFIDDKESEKGIKALEK